MKLQIDIVAKDILVNPPSDMSLKAHVQKFIYDLHELINSSALDFERISIQCAEKTP